MCTYTKSASIYPLCIHCNNIDCAINRHTAKIPAKT